MATVTGLTAERMQEIIDATITDADIVGGHLILTLHDGSTIDTGQVSVAIKGNAFPGAPTDGDLFVRTDQAGDPLYKYTDGAWVVMGGGGITKVNAFPTVPAPTDGDMVIRTDQVGDPLYKFTDGIWERQPRMGAQTVPAAKAYVGATQAIPDSVYTAVTLPSEEIDTDTIHDLVTNTSRLVVKTPGLYLVEAQLYFAGNNTGTRWLSIRKNGTAVPVLDSNSNPLAAASSTFVRGTTTVRLNAGDYLEIFAYQNSGGPLNLLGDVAAGSVSSASRLALTWIGGSGQTIDERGSSASRVQKGTTQSIPLTTYTAVSFNGTLDYDTDGMYSAATPTRLTAKTPGIYRVTAYVAFVAQANGDRQLALRKNGAAYINFTQGPTAAGGGEAMPYISTDVMLAAGDYIEVQAWQNSPGALNVDGGTFMASLIATGKTVTPYADASAIANFAIPNGVYTAIPFGGEGTDNDSIHDTVSNTTRLTCRTAGIYLVQGEVLFATNNAGTRRVLLAKSGNDIMYDQGHQTMQGGLSTIIPVVSLVELAVGDYVEIMAYQDSGGPLNSVGVPGNAGYGDASHLRMVKVGAPNAPTYEPKTRFADVYNAAGAQSIPTTAWTQANLTAPIDDSDAMRVGNDIVLNKSGVWMIGGSVEWAVADLEGIRAARYLIGASNYGPEEIWASVIDAADYGVSRKILPVFMFRANAGDHAKLQVLHTKNGGAINLLNARLQATYIGA